MKTERRIPVEDKLYLHFLLSELYLFTNGKFPINHFSTASFSRLEYQRKNKTNFLTWNFNTEQGIKTERYAKSVFELIRSDG